MGLLFKQGNLFKKRVDRNIVTEKYAKKVAKEVSPLFSAGKLGARKRFEKTLKKAKEGGIDREEMHENIGNMIVTGDIKESNAKKLAEKLGLTEKRFRKFEDVSEHYDRTGRVPRDRKVSDEAEINPKDEPSKIANKNAALVDSGMNLSPKDYKIQPEPVLPRKNNERPASIYDILNKKKHPDPLENNKKI